jgi:hypothetical protein
MKLKKKLRTLIILSVIAVVLGSAGLVLRNVFLNQLKNRIQSVLGFSEIHLKVFPPSIIIDDARSISTSPFFSAKRIAITISLRALLTKNRPISTVIEEPVMHVYAYESNRPKDARGMAAAALPFAVDQAWIKNGELYVWGEDFRIHSENINALFRRRQDHFYLRAEGPDNRIELDSFPQSLTGQLNLICMVKDKQVDIERLRIRGSGNYFNASGTIVDLFQPKIELQSSFKVQADLLAALLEIPFSWDGGIEGRGLITRENGIVRIEADLESGDTRLNQVPVRSLEGKLKYVRKGVSTVDLTVLRESPVRELVQVSFGGKKVWGYVSGFHLDPIIRDKDIDIPWPVRSPVWGNFTVEEQRLIVDGEFRDDVDETSAAGWPFNGRFRFEQKGNSFDFSSENLATSFSETSVDAKGTVGRNIDVSINGLIKDVKEAREFTSVILERPFSIPEIRGRGRGSIQIFGDYFKPRVTFDMALSPAGFDRFEATYVEGTAEFFGLDFSGRFRVEDVSYVGDIEVTSDGEETRADIRMVRGLVEDILPEMQISLPLRGQASGEFVYLEKDGQEDFSGDFRSRELFFVGQSLKQVSGKLESSVDRVTFPELRFILHGGDVAGSGSLDSAAGKFRIDARAENVDLSAFYPELKGFLALELKGGGLLGRDYAQGDFTVSDLVFPPFQPTESRGTLKLGFGEDILDVKAEGNFLPGENPYQVDFLIPLHENPLKGNFKGTFANLDLLLPWPGARGRINYVAELLTPGPLPHLNGAIDFQGEVFPFPGFPHAVRDYSGLIRVEDGLLTVRSLQGHLGGGELQGSGWLRLGEGGVESMNLFAEGSALDLTLLERSRALADGSMTLIKNQTEFLLNGDFRIQKLSWSREVDEKFVFSSTGQQPRGSGFFDDLALNIRLQANENVWVENSLGSFRGRFDLTINGNINSPTLLGDIEAVEGAIYFQDREFSILQGRLSFFNPLVIEPYISFLGETYVKDYRVTFSLDGLLNNLTPEFSSSPPLPPEDVLALLALGEAFRRTYHYDRTSQQGTASLLSFTLAEEAQKRAEDLFSIDRFRIDPFVMGSSAEMTARLTVGKKISRNFFILYSTNLASRREEITRIEWQITNDISIVGTRDEEGRVSIDVKIHKRF